VQAGPSFSLGKLSDHLLNPRFQEFQGEKHRFNKVFFPEKENIRAAGMEIGEEGWIYEFFAKKTLMYRSSKVNLNQILNLT